MNNLWRRVFRFRKIIIILAVIITIVFAYFALKIRINSDITAYMPKTDPVVKTFNHIGTEFGGNFLAVIILESDQIFTAHNIALINNLTNDLKQVDGIADVTSLTNIIDIKKSEDGIEVSKLISENALPELQTELDDLKDYVLSHAMYRGHIVSEDAQSSLIVCRLEPSVSQIQTVREIKKITQTMLHVSGVKLQVYFAGLPFQIMEINDIIRADLQLLIPLVGLVIALLLMISFRSFAGVVLPLSSVLVSIVIVLGLMSLLKLPLTIISNIIPVILFSTGSAYSIHIINRYRENRSEKWLSEISLPVALAAITTIAGFIAFVFGSYLTMIKQFGVFSGLGIMLSCVLSVFFVPSMLAVFPKPQPKHKFKQTQRMNLTKVSGFILKNNKLILGLSIIIIVMCGLGMPRLARISDMLDYFKPQSQMRISESAMKSKFGGSVPIQILVQGDISEPGVLTQMKNIKGFLQTQAGVYHPQSVVDLIEEMSDVIGEGRDIPDTKDKVSNLFFLLEGDETVRQMVNTDKTEAVLSAMTSSVSTKSGREVLKNLKHYLAGLDTTYATFSLTGSPLIYKHLDKSLTKSQIQSLIIALALVLVCLFLMLRSFGLAIIGLVPILYTLLVLFGFMGYARIPLDVATVLVGSVSVGIGIDYSIHFLSRYKKECMLTKNRYQALMNTLASSGQAILINVLTNAFGFLVLLFANLIPLQRFGILVAITMLSSGLSTITLVPSIILLNKNK